MAEENKNLIIGPELERIIDGSLGELLLVLLKSYDENILQVIVKGRFNLFLFKILV